MAVEIIDDTTNRPLDPAEVAAALIELRVNDDCNRAVLSASTVPTDGQSLITVPPGGSTFQWDFTKEEMARLCRGKTYAVGCRMTPSGGGTTQIFTGSLAYLDGEF